MCINSIDEGQAALASNRKVSLCTQTLACIAFNLVGIWRTYPKKIGGHLVKNDIFLSELLHFVSMIFGFQPEVMYLILLNCLKQCSCVYFTYCIPHEYPNAMLLLLNIWMWAARKHGHFI